MLLRGTGAARPVLAVTLGVSAVLSGAALLAFSGALITGAAQRPSTLLVLMPLITAVRFFGVARACLRYLERLVSHDLTLRAVGRLRAEVLARLVPLAPAALTGARGGDLLARVRADVDTLQGVWLRLIAPTVVAVLAGSLAVLLTALVSPPLAAVLAGLLVLLGAVVPAWTRARGRGAAAAAAEADAAFGSDGLDLVRGLADHLTGDGGCRALQELDASLARQVAAERTGTGLGAASGFAREAAAALGLVAALWLVGWDVAAGSTHPVLLAATALGVLGAFEAVGGLGAAWSAAEGISGAGERVGALARQVPAVTSPRHPLGAPRGSALSFEAVTFARPGAGDQVLRDLDLHLGEGDKIALVGPSGAGKSTVLDLALRVHDPGAGRVTLGGTDLRQLSLEDVRARFAWSPQVPQVLGGTLAGNLRIGRDDATREELEGVLTAVDLGHLLARTGLDGWIGESGERLSAGERARLSLARALLSPADVLLVDEPTAHLDPPLARRVLDLLAAERRGVLLVTHDVDRLGPPWRVVALRRTDHHAVARSA
jgi:thiol reductant ABC exporter CydC subunit